MTWRGVVAGLVRMCAGWREGGRERGGGARGETVFFTPKKRKMVLGAETQFFKFRHLLLSHFFAAVFLFFFLFCSF